LLEWLQSRTQTTTNIGNDVRKKNPQYTAGRDVSKTIIQNSMEASQKPKNRNAI
jgi:hypothetical protein